MTKKLKDLFESFSEMDQSAQMEKIREIRHSRSIERPAVAQKRQKREVKTSAKIKEKIGGMLEKLSDEEKQAIIKRLKEMKDES